MRIAINYETIKAKGDEVLPQLKELRRQWHEVVVLAQGMHNSINSELFDGVVYVDNKANIIDVTRQNKINIYVDLPDEYVDIIKKSRSIGTSTYLIGSSNNILKKVNDIYNQRKPSVERLWNRYHSDEILSMPSPRMSPMDYIRKQPINPFSIALNYSENAITTYDEFNDAVVKYAKILNGMGIKEGDYVSLCMANTPEIFELRYALYELGAVANFIFPIVDSEDKLRYCLNQGGSKYLFMLDLNYKKLRNVIDKTNIDKVVLMTPFESLPKMNKLYNISQKIKGFRPNDTGYMLFKDFSALKQEYYPLHIYTPNELSSIQYTSGTTGQPKPVEISGDSYNERVFQYKRGSDIDFFTPGQRYLQSLPICGVAYGEFMTHMGLVNGMENIVMPNFTPKSLGKSIKKYNIQAVSTTTSVYYEMISLNDVDFSSLTLAACGGEVTTKHDDEYISKGLQEKGFDGHLIVGNGSTETVITNATNQNEIYKPGTCGVCLPGNNCKIVDAEGNECGYNERGSIIYGNKHPMLKYHDNEQLTSKVKTPDGIEMGDYGFIDEDGYSSVLCRIKDVIAIDGKEYAPCDFSNMVYEVDGIKRCVTTNLHEGDKLARVCYVIKDDADREFVKEQVNSIIPSDLLEKIEVVEVDKIPITPTGKADLKSLETKIDKYEVTHKTKKFLKLYI